MSEQQKHLLVHLKLLAHDARKWAEGGIIGIIPFKSLVKRELAGKLKELESNVDKTLKRVRQGEPGLSSPYHEGDLLKFNNKVEGALKKSRLESIQCRKGEDKDMAIKQLGDQVVGFNQTSGTMVNRPKGTE